MERVAVVTGADRGLGLALTAQLAEAGWRVFAGQFLPDWPELEEQVTRHADRVTIVPLDVSSQASAQMASRRVEAKNGRGEILPSPSIPLPQAGEGRSNVKLKGD